MPPEAIAVEQAMPCSVVEEEYRSMSPFQLNRPCWQLH
jgi:hypothetical protein